MLPEHIIVHHSITPRDQDPKRAEQGINNTHKVRFNFRSSLGWYVGYQYIIYGNGEIRQYRKDTEAGAHTKEQLMNFKSIGVCLTGNFDIELPSAAQINTLTKFLKEKSKQYKIKSIRPHRFYAAYKSCYGSKLKDDWASSLINESQTMKLVKDKGTVYIVTGNNDRRKIGIADLESLGLFGDEPQESMDTSGIKEYNTIVGGKVITHK
jgi:N-acetylmuramoyl-L-alanine amidase